MTFLLCLHAALLALSRLYPFTDLPNHLAAATIIRCYKDPGTDFSLFYALKLFPKPNVFHLLFCGLKVFPSVEAANRIFFCLYLVLLPLSTFLLIKKLGGNRWFSLLSFLFLYNYSTSWGFAGFVFSIPFILLTVYLSILFLERGRAGNGLALTLCLVMLFFTHAQSLFFAALLFLVLCLFHRGLPAAQKIGRLYPLSPAAALTLAWWWGGRSAWSGQGLLAFLGDYYISDFLKTFPRRLGLLYLDNYHLYDGPRGRYIALGFSLFVIFFAVLYLLQGFFHGRHKAPGMGATSPPGRTIEPAPREKVGLGKTVEMREKDDLENSAVDISYYAITFATVAAAAYFLLPLGIPGQSILYQRFSALLFLSLIVLGSLWIGRMGRGTIGALIFLLSLWHFTLWAGYFVDFNRENRHFSPAFLPERAPAEILSGFIYDYRFRGRPLYIHFPNYHIVWKRGIACTSLVGYRFGAVTRKAPARVLPPYLAWIGNPLHYSHENYDGRYGSLDYILTRGLPPPGKEWHLSGFEPIRSAGKWHLYSNRRRGSEMLRSIPGA